PVVTPVSLASALFFPLLLDSRLGTLVSSFFFFFNDTPTTEIYTLSLHDALPICPQISYGVRESRRRDAGATELSLDVLAGCLHHFRIITEITHCCRPRRGRQEERNTPWPPRRLQLKSAATSLMGAGWSHALAARSSGV